MEISNQTLSYVPFALFAENSSADDAVEALIAVVDQNEVDSDAADAENASAIAAVQAEVDQFELNIDAAVAAVQADVDGNEEASDDADARTVSLAVGGGRGLGLVALERG